MQNSFWEVCALIIYIYMKILNFSISYPINSNNIYSDLNEALAQSGHEVKVVYADPKLDSKNLAEISQKNGVEILRVKTMSVQKTNVLKKGLSFLALPYLLKRATKKFYKDEHFDLILFTAPPVTFASIVAWAKKFYHCPAFLMQKDIFPQNAIDLKMFSKFSPIFFHFRRKEINMLKVSDWIGCMSQGNIDYLLNHNRFLKKERVIYFPNTEKIKPFCESDFKDQIRKKYEIPNNSCVFLFGGNMGKPQHLDLICSALRHFNKRHDIFFVCIGAGTESKKLQDCIENENISNAKFFSSVPRDDYNKIANSCDVGLVTLSPDFTIPNYPSKTLAYLNSKLPILAATDTNTDYRNLIEDQAKCGLWCDSSKPKDFFSAIEYLSSNPQKRIEFGENGRKYSEENFDVLRSVKILENIFTSKAD